MLITSKNNETIKEIKKMKYKKYRNGRFLVEGIKMVKEAINENADIELIVIKEGTIIDIDISKYKNIEVTKNVFSELTDVVTPQGVLAVIKKDFKQNNEINYSQDFFIALDDIQDPGNLGTILRTADAANIKQVIVTKNTVDAFDPKVIRATMGAIFRIQIIETDNLPETLEKLKLNGFETIITDLSANQNIYNINYNKKVVVIGNEANGVSDDVKKIADKKVKIPMLGKTESLNASVAAGIMIYEYVRQKVGERSI